MTPSELKLNLYQLIDRTNDDSKLQAIYTLLSKWKSTDKEDIQIGLKQAENNEFISHEEVMSDVDKLLGRE